jgi:hypothetical protein
VDKINGRPMIDHKAAAKPLPVFRTELIIGKP